MPRYGIRALWTAMIALTSLLSFGCGSDSYIASSPTAPVLAYGDSVTWGYGGLPYGWVGRLESYAQVSITNAGVPGETAEQGVRRLPAVLAVNPMARTVLILHGGNNWTRIVKTPPCDARCAPEEVKDRYDKVARDLKRMGVLAMAAGKRPVYATYWHSSPNRCSEYFDRDFENSQIHLDYLNGRIEQIARELGTSSIPLHRDVDLTGDSTNYFDCLHPGPKGYDQVAQAFYDHGDKWMPTIGLPVFVPTRPGIPLPGVGPIEVPFRLPSQ